MSQYNLSSEHWPGLSKLLEEAGEVIQVGGKIMGLGANQRETAQALHWDGSDLKLRLEEELADLLAAQMFVESFCGLDSHKISERATKKLDQFLTWRREGK